MPDVFIRWFVLVILAFSWRLAPGQVGISLPDSVDKYRKAGQFLSAYRFAREWHRSLEIGGSDSARIDALEIMVDLSVRLNENRQAIGYIHEWMSMLGRQAPIDSLDFAAPYNRLGTVYYNLADYARSLVYYGKSQDLRIRFLGADHPEVARSLSNMGNVYLMTGNYRKAEELYRKAHEIRLKKLPRYDPALGHSNNGLGLVYRHLGDYPKSESHFLKALEINKKNLGPDHPNVGAVLTNLATLAEFIGDYEKAETYFLEGLRIRKAAHGDSNVLVAQTYFLLAHLYEAQNRLQKADSVLFLGGILYRRAYGDGHLLMANYHFLKGECLGKSGQLQLAMAELESAQAIWLTAFGPNHLKVAQARASMGNLFFLSRQSKKALECFRKSLPIQKNALGIRHPAIGRLYHQIARAFMRENQEDSAIYWFNQAVAHYKVQIETYFPTLSDREKEVFFDASARVFKEYFAFASLIYPKRPAIAGDMFNLVLATKAMLLNNSARWKRKIRESGDRKLLHLYGVWESNQNLISRLMTAQDTSIRDSLHRLTGRTEKLEKELSSRFVEFEGLASRKRPTWQEIRSALQSRQAAVEIVRISPWGQISEASGVQEVAQDLRMAWQLLDQPVYLALILKHGDARPRLVMLNNGAAMEGSYLGYYRTCIRQKMPDTLSLSHFWKPIARALGPIPETVFFSPDGVYHFLNPSTLYSPEKGKFLQDLLDIRLVTVTHDLIGTRPPSGANRLSYLFGNPRFEVGTDSVPEVQRSSPGFQVLLKAQLSSIPQTAVEIKAIQDLFIEKGWDVHAFGQEEATEAKIKDMFSPGVLHVATHGYFIQDSTLNPLICSGLFFSPSGQREQDFTRSEDGILTAYETMNLNLDNTDLVVLSACETGLGEIKNGEGVYGLQRAFKVAGARSIIMSLWKVDDAATRELMVRFYRNWLQQPEASGSGKSAKRRAFLAAQRELKAQFPHPYYWGAFVLVGE